MHLTLPGIQIGKGSDGKKVTFYRLFLDGAELGPFTSKQARQLHASLASQKLTDKLPQFPGKTRLKQKAGAKRSKFEYYLQCCARDPAVTTSAPFQVFLRHFVFLAASGPSSAGSGGPGAGSSSSSGGGNGETGFEISVTPNAERHAGSQVVGSTLERSVSTMDLSYRSSSYRERSSPSKSSGRDRSGSTSSTGSTSSVSSTNSIGASPSKKKKKSFFSLTRKKKSTSDPVPSTLPPRERSSSGSGNIGGARSEPATAAGSAAMPTALANTSSSSGGGVGSEIPRRQPPVDRSLPGAEVVLEGDQLSCVGLQLARFPRWLAETNRTRITKIDLTGGALHNLSALEVCECLDTIIADECELSDADLTYLPSLPDTLRALSLNKNKIESLLGFIGFASMKFPNLTFLSLLGNPCCRSELVEDNPAAVKAYRDQLVLSMPQLGWIDSVVTVDDRFASGRLNCRSLNVDSVPTWLPQGAALAATTVDFSSSSCQNFMLLTRFSALQTLVVERVGLITLEGFPALPNLTFLSLAHNRIRVLHRMMKALQKKFGKLTHLSLLGNPCCPEPFPDSLEPSVALRQEEYERFRVHMTMALPTLKMLDGRITDDAQEQGRAWYAGAANKIDCRAAVLSANDGDFLVREVASTTPPLPLVASQIRTGDDC